MKVGVVHGGYSSEKGVSTENAKHIAKTLVDLKYDVCMIGYSKDIVQKLKEEKIDIVYVCVQGKGHGDGTIQAILDHEGIPYTGSKTHAASIINDKIMCKFLFDYYGIPTPKWEILSMKQYKSGEFDYNEIGFPLVAKAPSQGGSFGIELISNETELSKIENVFIYDEQILLEKFIKGKFYTTGILERNRQIQLLKCVEGIAINNEEVGENRLIEFTGEYKTQLPSISKEDVKKMDEISEKIFEITEGEDVARIDFIYSDEEKVPYVLEINAVPGLKPSSLLPGAAAFSEIKYSDVIEGILLSAWTKYKEKCKC